LPWAGCWDMSCRAQPGHEKWVGFISMKKKNKTSNRNKGKKQEISKGRTANAPGPLKKSRCY
jgi:hypothetical protein